MLLQERFRLITTYRSPTRVIPFYDVKHFEERVAERVIRHLGQPRSVVIDILLEGCAVIEASHDFVPDEYMIVSPSRNIKIPVTVTQDKYKPDHPILGLIPTILWVNTDYDQRPHYKDILVESMQHPIAIPLFEGASFIDYFDKGELIPSYETIYVK